MTTDPTTTEPAAAGLPATHEFMAREYHRQVDRIVRDLHQAASQFRLEATPRASALVDVTPEPLDYTHAAASAVDRLHNALAGLGLTGLFGAAKDADACPAPPEESR
jgi:hypothetical protein